MMSKEETEGRCKLCGCFMQHVDNSFLGEGGWVEDEWFQCNNPKCKKNSKNKSKKG